MEDIGGAGFGGVFEVHEEVDALHFGGADEFFEDGLGAFDAGAAGDVADDDVLAAEVRDDFGEVFGVEVFAGLGFGEVVGVVEGAFRQKRVAVDDVGVFEDGAFGGVAEIGDEGDFGAAGDFDALFFQVDDVGLGEGEVFVFEFGADGDEGVAEGGLAVVGGEGSDAEIAADLVEVAGHHGEDAVGGGLAFDFSEGLEHVVDGAGKVHRDEERGGLHALEEALRGEVGEAGDVVHVAVGEAENVGGERPLGGTAGVEADGEFRDLDDGFLAGDGVTEDGV